jgi:hypothetical protein
MASKEELIEFLEREVLRKNEIHAKADEIIKRKVRCTRMRLNQLENADKVEQYFWSAMSSDNGIDSYTKIAAIGSPTFEDVRAEFIRICGHED